MKSYGGVEVQSHSAVTLDYVVGSKSFRADQLFKVTEIKQLCYFSTQSSFISTHFSTDTLTSPQMALYIPHSIFHSARLLVCQAGNFWTLLFRRNALANIRCFVISIRQCVPHIKIYSIFYLNVEELYTLQFVLLHKFCSFLVLRTLR